jgi:hypothetical protein
MLSEQHIFKKNSTKAQNFHNNKPDGNGKGTCLLINTEISEDINLIQ